MRLLKSKYFTLSYIFIFNLLLMFSISGKFFGNTIGKSCPPCTEEKTLIQNEYQLLQVAFEAKTIAEDNAKKTQIALQLARRIVLSAQEASAYARIGNRKLSAAIAGLNAALINLDTAQKEHKKVLANLYIAQKEVNSSRTNFQEARQRLVECKARAYPGSCKKCEDGIVKADDTQRTGSPCTECKDGEIVDVTTLVQIDECRKCLGGKVINKPDGAPVINEPCKECREGTIAKKANGFPCDDGDPTTKNDRCINGKCVGDPVTSNENPEFQ